MTSEVRMNSADPDRSRMWPDWTEMKWIEISVEASAEAAEAVSALFNEYSWSGTVLEELWPDTSHAHVIRVKAFLPAEYKAVLPRIEEAVWHLGQIHPLQPLSIRWLAEADWMEAWKSSYDVQHIGRRIVVKPSWLSYVPSAGQIVIKLDPGIAFGTGLHPSTRLCLSALEDCLQPGDRVLDVGTGSGILAITAARLGARSVVALDVDSAAVKVARQNVVRNSVETIVSLRRASLYPLSTADRNGERVETFNALGLWTGAFDVLLMNILADVIVQSAEALAACLSENGLFVVSGITEPQERVVRDGLAATGLTIAERFMEHDWVALIGHLTHGHRETGRPQQSAASCAG